MSKKSYRQAINEALRQEMERDPRVIVMGEDVAGGMGAPGEDDAWGGPLGVTKGLMPKFGRDRVLDTPISEIGLHRRGGGRGGDRASAGGRADVRRLHGRLLRPDLQPGGEVPLHVRRQGGDAAGRAHHVRRGLPGGLAALQCLYPLFTHIPGLKVVVPSNAYEAKGLLIQAIRDDDPVIFFEHKAMYDEEMEVPDEPYTIPFGEANVTREGDDVTIIAVGRMVNFANQAADALAKKGVSVHGGRPAHDLAARRRDDAGDGAGDRAAWWWSTRRIRAARWPPTSRR